MASLGGHTILIADDEPFIASGVGDALTDAGAEVVTALDLRTAFGLAINGDIHAAIPDVTLGGADSGAVCTALKSRHVPFMFLTGYDAHDLLCEWLSVPILAKPAGEAELVANVEVLLNRGHASEEA